MYSLRSYANRFANHIKIFLFAFATWFLMVMPMFAIFLGVDALSAGAFVFPLWWLSVYNNL